MSGLHPEQTIQVTLGEIFELPPWARSYLKKLEEIGGLWVTAEAILTLCGLLREIEYYKAFNLDGKADREGLVAIGKATVEAEDALRRAVEATGGYLKYFLDEAQTPVVRLVSGLRKALDKAEEEAQHGTSNQS